MKRKYKVEKHKNHNFYTPMVRSCWWLFRFKWKYIIKYYGDYYLSERMPKWYVEEHQAAEILGKYEVWVIKNKGRK